MGLARADAATGGTSTFVLEGTVTELRGSRRCERDFDFCAHGETVSRRADNPARYSLDVLLEWAETPEAWGRIGDRLCDPAAYGGVRSHNLDIERNKKPQLKELRPWLVRCPR